MKIGSFFFYFTSCVKYACKFEVQKKKKFLRSSDSGFTSFFSLEQRSGVQSAFSVSEITILHFVEEASIFFIQCNYFNSILK